MRCMMCSNYLVDDDSGWLPELSLWNKYVKDSILQRGLDSVMFNTAREVEGTAELSEAAFCDPVAGLRLRFGNSLLLGLGDGF